MKTTEARVPAKNIASISHKPPRVPHAKIPEQRQAPAATFILVFPGLLIALLLLLLKLAANFGASVHTAAGTAIQLGYQRQVLVLK
jgi:hypothetical protein